jgi:hypothetical protein
MSEASVVVEEQKEVEELLLALDLECTGPQLGREILEIGAVLAKKDGTILAQRSFCGKVPPPGDFDPDTWNWWLDHPESLARIDAEAEPDHERAFFAWLRALDEVYGPFKKENSLRLVSDNPGYDLAKIAVRAFHYEGYGAKLVAEMFGYKPTSDPTEQEAFLNDEQRKYVESHITSPHSHKASDDALNILQRYIGIINLKRKLGIAE